MITNVYIHKTSIKDFDFSQRVIFLIFPSLGRLNKKKIKRINKNTIKSSIFKGEKNKEGKYFLFQVRACYREKVCMAMKMTVFCHSVWNV